MSPIGSAVARLARGRVVRHLARHRAFLTGSALFLGVLVVAVLADAIAPTAPAAMRFRDRFTPPGAAFPLGTDNFGRNLLSRVVYGARLSLEIGFSVDWEAREIKVLSLASTTGDVPPIGVRQE